MKTFSKRTQVGFTAVEMVVSTAIMAILGLVFIQVLNSGIILYTKNTAVNAAHEEAREGIIRMTRDIHASISVPQLRTADAASLLPSDSASVVSSTPSGTAAPMAPGVSFQNVVLGPQYVWKDPSGNGPIMVKGDPTLLQPGMHLLSPLYGVEDDVTKVTATPTAANHHNVWVTQSTNLTRLTRAPGWCSGCSSNSYSILYYTNRVMYLVKNGSYIPDSAGPFILTVATYSSGTAPRYNLKSDGSYVPNASGTYTVSPTAYTSGNSQRYRYEKGELHLYTQSYDGSAFYWKDTATVARYISSPTPFYVPLVADSNGTWYQSTNSYLSYTTSSANSTGSTFNGGTDTRYVGVKLSARDPSSSNRGYLATASLLNTQIDYRSRIATNQ
jgi:Tfp pilus assembly protein PilE